MPTFEDYDMISDIIGWLGQSVCYKFVVKLGSRDKDGNRNPFHKEYTYNSTYSNVEKVTSIRRSFDYYLTIENTYKNVYIQIRQQNMIMIQSVLSQVSGLLFDENYWAIKSKKLVVKNKPQPIFVQNLPMGKWLSFELIVIEYEGQYDKGIRIMLSDESEYLDIRIDAFMGFVYFMNCLNMYQSALSIVNYLQRPVFGTNLVEFDNNTSNYNNSRYNNDGEVYTKGNRTIGDKTRKKSFFDRVDDITK